MEYYNVDDSVKSKGQQNNDVKMPPEENILAAADHIRKLFEGRKFGYAFMGGLEMLCLGHRREMPDLQIAYDDKDFHKMKSKLESDQRIRLPEGMNSLFPAKIHIRTGPAYKHEGCTHPAEVEVDLVPPGSHGTPSNGSLARNTVLLSLKHEGKLRSYKGLNMLYLVKTLVHYCRVQDLAWDPRKDLLFLCQHYDEQVQSMRSQLDQKAVQHNLLATPFFAQLSKEDQRRCYLVLLGTEPPPTMALTPPPPLFSHKHSASDPDASVRPRLSSHQSSPSLNTHISVGLLRPPLSGKPRSASSHLSVGRSQVSEISRPSDSGPRKPSELSAATRESRSRYRPVSAPNTRRVSPVEVQTTAPTATHVRQRSQPPAKLTHRLAPNPTPMNHLQPPYQHQILGAAHPREPACNPKAGPVPPFAFAHTPALNQPASGLRQYQSPTNGVELSGAPVTGNPGQQHLKSQLGLAGNLVPPQKPISTLPITPRPIPPPARPSHTDDNPKSAEVHTNSTPKSRFYVTNPDVEEAIPSICTQHLDTPPPAAEIDTVSQLGHFIAELSAEHASPTAHVDPGLNNATQRAQAIGAPVAPATPPEPVIRPLQPRTPGTTLPASLMAGGSSPHHRTSSSSSTAGSSAPVSNASRYTRYYATPPSSPPSTYKAYQPSPVLPMSPPSMVLGSVSGEEACFKQGDDAGQVGETVVDSRALAMEYQRELVGLEAGYTREY